MTSWSGVICQPVPWRNDPASGNDAGTRLGSGAVVLGIASWAAWCAEGRWDLSQLPFRNYHDADWDNVLLYDLTINSGKVHPEQAVDLIVCYVQQHG